MNPKVWKVSPWQSLTLDQIPTLSDHWSFQIQVPLGAVNFTLQMGDLRP